MVEGNVNNAFDHMRHETVVKAAEIFEWPYTLLAVLTTANIGAVVDLFIMDMEAEPLMPLFVTNREVWKDHMLEDEHVSCFFSSTG